MGYSNVFDWPMTSDSALRRYFRHRGVSGRGSDIVNVRLKRLPLRTLPLAAPLS